MCFCFSINFFIARLNKVGDSTIIISVFSDEVIYIIITLVKKIQFCFVQKYPILMYTRIMYNAHTINFYPFLRENLKFATAIILYHN